MTIAERFAAAIGIVLGKTNADNAQIASLKTDLDTAQKAEAAAKTTADQATAAATEAQNAAAAATAQANTLSAQLAEVGDIDSIKSSLTTLEGIATAAGA